MESEAQQQCLRCQTILEYLGERTYRLEGAFPPMDNFHVYRCPTCGHVEFFAFVVTDIQCLECGATIKPTDRACPQCGWTWEEAEGTEATEEEAE